jgi:hypothetical protein
MKQILIVVFIFSCFSGFAQSQFYNRAFEAKYMQKPPVFPAGKDSLRRFYFMHFPAFDTVINKAVEKGDTAKFIRIYFSFFLDENGFAYEPSFDRVASTRSGNTENAKTIKYFFDMKPVLDKAIKDMVNKMPQWRPGIQDGVIVKTQCEDYLQFWVGLTPPQ